MDAHFLSEAVKDNLTDSLNEMITLFRAIRPINNEPYTQALDRLIASQAPPRNQIDTAAEEFTFDIPEHTYETMIARLRDTALREGVHYKDVHNNTFMNTNMNCFQTTPPALAGTRARTALITATPNATQEQRQAEHDRASAEQQTFNDAAALQPPVWEIMQRQGNNDIRQEDSLLIFLDTQRKQPHWYKIIHNLKTYGEQSGYTLNHYKRCLDRFVGFFAPHLSPVTDNLEPVDLAKFLLKLTMPEPTKDRLTQQLASLTRQPNTPLRFVINELLAIAKVYYHDNTPEEKEVLINRLMILGLTQFTTGETCKHLKTTTEYAAAYNKQLDWKKLLDSATYSERINGTPQQNLSFKPPSGTSMSLFHSELLPLDLPEFLPPNPVDEPILYNHDTSEQPQRYQQPKQTFQTIRTPAPQPVIQPHPNIPRQRRHRTPPPTPPTRPTSPPVPKTKKDKRLRENSQSRTPPSPKPRRSTRSSKQKLPLNQMYTNNKSPQSSQPNSNNTSRSNSNTSRSSWTSRSRSQSPYQPQKKQYEKPKYYNKQKQTSSTYKKPTYQSKYKQNRSPSPYQRQQSRSPYRSNDNKSKPYRSNNSYKQNNYKSPDKRSYSQSPNRPSYNKPYNKSQKYNPSRSQSRDKSPSSQQKQFPGFLPGVNCSTDYLPWISKNCKKCCTYADHHECYCPQYYRFNQTKCSTCRTGYHMPSECKSRRSQSPAKPKNYNVHLN